MKTTAPRYIDASKEATLKLAKAFRVTEKFVYLCLTYRKNNETARKFVLSQCATMKQNQCSMCPNVRHYTTQRRTAAK